jgi:hypothetical protein
MGIDLSVPDHTTLSRRGQLLVIDCGESRPVEAVTLSSILWAFYHGRGEWARAKYGVRGTRGWKKLHLAVDRSGVIVAETLTRVMWMTRQLLSI